MATKPGKGFKKGQRTRFTSFTTIEEGRRSVQRGQAETSFNDLMWGESLA